MLKKMWKLLWKSLKQTVINYLKGESLRKEFIELIEKHKDKPLELYDKAIDWICEKIEKI